MWKQIGIHLSGLHPLFCNSKYHFIFPLTMSWLYNSNFFFAVAGLDGSIFCCVNCALFGIIQVVLNTSHRMEDDTLEFLRQQALSSSSKALGSSQVTSHSLISSLLYMKIQNKAHHYFILLSNVNLLCCGWESQITGCFCLRWDERMFENAWFNRKK